LFALKKVGRKKKLYIEEKKFEKLDDINWDSTSAVCQNQNKLNNYGVKGGYGGGSSRI
jgi:hypothetical protein